MSADFAALAAAVEGSLPEVRVCLLVSRDGLPLAACPATEESGALQAWLRLSAIGEISRGFVAVGNHVWVFCRRGPYGALAIAEATAHPAIVLDRIEQALLLAIEARARREFARTAEEAEGMPEVQTEPGIMGGDPDPLAGVWPPPAEGDAVEGKFLDGGAASGGGDGDGVTDAEPAPEGGGHAQPSVDVIAIAREFSGLLNDVIGPQGE